MNGGGSADHPALPNVAFAEPMKATITQGNLLDQEVEVIVNSWNRNLIPWWLLLPRGVSGAIKKRAGYRPFVELRRRGVLPLGGAVMTSAGRLPHRGIIHVAGIGHDWTANETSIRSSVRNALLVAAENHVKSIAFPLIGAGTGGMKPSRVEQLMTEEIERSPFAGEVRIVEYTKMPANKAL
jgi:O-acetyl-ADP-ribose deacetylase